MEIRVYVVNLGIENRGFKKGGWFTLPVDTKEIREKLGADKQYDALSIRDFEAPFFIRRDESIEELNKIAEFLASLNEDDIVIEALFRYLKRDEALEKLKNGEYRVYRNCSTMADVAYQIYEETGQLDAIEKVISPAYIDWESIGRDLEIEGFFIYAGNDCYVEVIQ